MFGQTQTSKTRLLISNMRSTPVTIYDSNNTYLLTFKNNVELSKYLGCNKSTLPYPEPTDPRPYWIL